MKEKVLSLVFFAVALAVFMGLDPIIHQALAGTGGAEVQTWWTDLTNGLKGYWGKIIAIAFIGLAILAGKSGSIIFAFFLFFIGLSIGTLPDIVDSRYTLLF